MKSVNPMQTATVRHQVGMFCLPFNRDACVTSSVLECGPLAYTYTSHFSVIFGSTSFRMFWQWKIRFYSKRKLESAYFSSIFYHWCFFGWNFIWISLSNGNHFFVALCFLVSMFFWNIWRKFNYKFHQKINPIKMAINEIKSPCLRDVKWHMMIFPMYVVCMFTIVKYCVCPLDFPSCVWCCAIYLKLDWRVDVRLLITLAEPKSVH